MGGYRRLIGASALALLLAGCSFAEDNLLPTLTGDQPAKSEASAAPATATKAAPSEAEQAKPTGTAVGKQVAERRAELVALKAAIGQRQAAYDQLQKTVQKDLEAYLATASGIAAHLYIGTTPANPVLISQSNAAYAQLERLGADVEQMTALSNQAAGDSDAASKLLEGVRAAYGLEGGVDEDHRQLKLIEDETHRSTEAINGLLGETRRSAARAARYVTAERKRLASLTPAIKVGELPEADLAAASGAAVASNSAVTSGASNDVAPTKPAAATGKKQPLVVIRFASDDVDYHDALFEAVSTALERRPQSRFEVIGIAPAAGAAESSRRNAERVRRSMLEMGVPEKRVSVSTATNASAEVAEVHVYVR